MGQRKMPKLGAKVVTRLEDLGDELTIREAAAVAGVHTNTIRKAIRSGALAARLPWANADPKRFGILGYRITRRALHEWLFGASAIKGKE